MLHMISDSSSSDEEDDRTHKENITVLNFLTPFLIFFYSDSVRYEKFCFVLAGVWSQFVFALLQNVNVSRMLEVCGVQTRCLTLLELQRNVNFTEEI